LLRFLLCAESACQPPSYRLIGAPRSLPVKILLFPRIVRISADFCCFPSTLEQQLLRLLNQSITFPRMTLTQASVEARGLSGRRVMVLTGKPHETLLSISHTQAPLQPIIIILSQHCRALISYLHISSSSPSCHVDSAPPADSKLVIDPLNHGLASLCSPFVSYCKIMFEKSFLSSFSPLPIHGDGFGGFLQKRVPGTTHSGPWRGLREPKKMFGGP
jgi:hypothetical protein